LITPPTHWIALVCIVACAGAVQAAPRVPANDSDIVETLPSVAGWSNQQRRLRRELAQRPRDEGVAIAAARAYLELARSEGDARYAGYAMGALQAWNSMSAAETPPAVLVMRATVEQFLHDFDGAEATLKEALARQPANPQAWITLATILRVRGRYAESDTACTRLGRVGPPLYGVACLAENAGLRGDHAAARNALQGLLADPALQGSRQASTRQWLLTSVAEVEELAGRPAAADAAYRQALEADRSGYLLLVYSDFLQSQGRPSEIASLLAKEPRSDAVLLRLAIAARATVAQAKSPSLKQRELARQEADELRSRFAAAALRPGTTAIHAREEAMFALDVQGDAQRALQLARINVKLQREPVDLRLFARAAVAARDDAARGEVKALMRQIGLQDARVDAILS
jgi:Tfp pilus assembly protein PilF